MQPISLIDFIEHISYRCINYLWRTNSQHQHLQKLLDKKKQKMIVNVGHETKQEKIGDMKESKRMKRILDI